MSKTTEAPSARRVLGASLVGTAVEFYDFYIYATAASLVFGPLFFPDASPSMQLLSSYASMAVAFFARPVGAIVFGHYGDRIGRKSTLVASLLLMGASTVLIAFLPTYQQAGWLAPVMLCILRFGQGFGLGGEWGGAALLAVENAPPGWRARYGMFPQLGAPVGFIAANGLFLILGMLLTQEQFQAWGWRIPFLGSALLVGVGLWVRLKLTETPAFSKALAEEKPSDVPLAELFKRHLGPTLAGTFAVVACFATFYLATAFALGYGTQTLGYSRETFLSVQLGAIGFMALGIVLAGYWSDATNPRRVLMAGCLMAIAVGALMAPMMGGGSLLGAWAFLSLALLTMGFVYGPLGAFLPGLFPARVRYTGASMAFNVGGIIGGGLTPMIAQALSTQGGLVPVGIYLGVAALISLVALLPLKHQQA
ncbi:MFS transporter [Phenylobacterium sp. Root77]|jgi:metabolite-proton symporter|uniref:MFS transporter n=1 Tax=unclassified Phenylobacterium TaxID=2640670 RepID=UPI0006F2AC7C|nr:MULTISPECIES: MFS transporter [unclassified Phenylobacterium]KQW70406.1 MFS transporter [Phenylobacterium sp. Root1277]KQW91173.1 MFS transporter [Phenylobacterium sp. Root1290]KRC39190.1 MFS transporter [Phenylobacterium sp. Root77]